MKITGQLALVLLANGLFSTASANIYTWNLIGSKPNQTIGNTDTLTSDTGSLSLTLSGYVINSGVTKASPLYAKSDSGDEIGIGINADPTSDHEIFANSFVQINLTSLLAQRAISVSALNLAIGSVQSGEGFDIWGSNTAGTEGTLLMTGGSSLDDVTFSIPQFGQYNYISISATSGDNVLLDTLSAKGTALTVQTAASAPEPSTLFMGILGAGLIVASKIKRRR